jgi:hypothetical protein
VEEPSSYLLTTAVLQGRCSNEFTYNAAVSRGVANAHIMDIAQKNGFDRHAIGFGRVVGRESEARSG